MTNLTICMILAATISYRRRKEVENWPGLVGTGEKRTTMLTMIEDKRTELRELCNRYRGAPPRSIRLGHQRGV